jgi:uncharacterized BrkB/YihY/UPF0761 family membrane protein
MTGSISYYFVLSLFFTMAFLIFLLIFKVTLNTNTHWRYVWVGALLSAGLFGLAQAVTSAFFSRFGRLKEVYGSVAWSSS